MHKKADSPRLSAFFQTVDKVYFFDLCCKSLAEFRRPQTAEEGQIVFSGGVYVGKHTSQAASVRAKASARRGLHPLSKMLAFLRSVSKFFDTLRAPDVENIRGPLVLKSYFSSSPVSCAGSLETKAHSTRRSESRST